MTQSIESTVQTLEGPRNIAQGEQSIEDQLGMVMMIDSIPKGLLNSNSKCIHHPLGIIEFISTKSRVVDTVGMAVIAAICRHDENEAHLAAIRIQSAIYS